MGCGGGRVTGAAFSLYSIETFAPIPAHHASVTMALTVTMDVTMLSPSMQLPF